MPLGVELGQNIGLERFLPYFDLSQAGLERFLPYFDLSQAGDADSSWAPGLTSGLQGSMNVHCGALLLVPQWQCISSFVFYLFLLGHTCFTNACLVLYHCKTSLQVCHQFLSMKSDSLKQMKWKYTIITLIKIHCSHPLIYNELAITLKKYISCLTLYVHVTYKCYCYLTIVKLWW